MSSHLVNGGGLYSFKAEQRQEPPVPHISRIWSRCRSGPFGTLSTFGETLLNYIQTREATLRTCPGDTQHILAWEATLRTGSGDTQFYLGLGGVGKCHQQCVPIAATLNVLTRGARSVKGVPLALGLKTSSGELQRRPQRRVF